MSTSEPSGASTIAIDPALGEILRDQTLLILEIKAGSFEEARELPPDELEALASTFRDAFVVLDTIGWLPEQQTETVLVTITAAHLAQLEHMRADLGIGVFDRLDTRHELDSPEGRAEVDEQIEADRVTADGLWQILRACSRGAE